MVKLSCVGIMGLSFMGTRRATQIRHDWKSTERERERERERKGEREGERETGKRKNEREGGETGGGDKET